MVTDKFIPSTNFIDALPEICTSLELVSVYDLECHSVPHLVYVLAQKINQTITNMEHNDEALKAHLEDLQVKLEYLLGEGLMTELQKIFEKMYVDGTLQSLVEASMVDIKRRLELLEAQKHAVIGVETVAELKAAINDIVPGGTIKLLADLDIAEAITIAKSITLDGCGYKLKCITNGLHDWIKMSGETLIVKNVKFDDNLKGRVILAVENTNSIIVENCDFTGYSKEYGYYRTDGLVRLDGGVVEAIFKDCNFHDSGYNLGTATEDLNRCISFNYTDIKRGLVDNCRFERVNQAIVSVIKDLTVRDCYFYEVNDNALYISGSTLNVIGCVFENQNDEPIITSCSTNHIKGNSFNKFSNKAIAATASMSSLICDGNTFKNNNESGQVLAFREGSDVKHISFCNNTVLSGETKYTNSSPLITSGSCELFSCSYNYIECNLPSDSQGIIRTAGKKLSFNENRIQQLGGSTVLAVKLDGTANVSYSGNILTGCRLSGAEGVIGNTIETNANYITSETNSILFCSVKPGYILKKGTVIHNSNYSGLNSVIAWISDGTEWIEQRITRPYVHDRTNTPVNWSFPRYPGDIWIGNAGSVWIGVGAGSSSSDWKKLVD